MHLIAIPQKLRQIHPGQIGVFSGSARRCDGVLHTRILWQAVARFRLDDRARDINFQRGGRFGGGICRGGWRWIDGNRDGFVLIQQQIRQRHHDHQPQKCPDYPFETIQQRQFFLCHNPPLID
jgi:hypothetical protein